MRVVINAAVSADGKLSSRRREQIEISGPADFDRVDHLRAEHDAIVVGIGTVLADDPHLTLDDPEGSNPARVVADSNARTPPDAKILDGDARTYILVGDDAPADRVTTLQNHGARVVTAGANDHVDLVAAMVALENEGIYNLMVEGGGELIFSLFEAELVDELSVYVGPKIIGGRDAPTLADGDGFVEDFPELSLDGVDQIDDGVLLRWTPV